MNTLLRINMNQDLDALQINFDSEGLFILNLALAIIMFGVALGITKQDFIRLIKSPRILFTGLVSQFVLLPLVTFFYVNLIDPLPSIALGLFMVAACPGGNISNFITHFAKGNSALSVSLTAFATLLSMVMTPFNFHFWGNMYEPTAEILKTVSLDPWKLVELVALLLGVPLVLGMYFRAKNERLALKISNWLKPFSFAVFLVLIGAALAKNWNIILNYVQFVAILVIVHNLLAILTGFSFAKLMKLNFKDQKTLAIETGIQNAGLGLLLIFSFFEGLGGMALLVAFWAIWDIFSGLALGLYWSKTKN